jgi:hypothetical protein
MDAIEIIRQFKQAFAAIIQYRNFYQFISFKNHIT